MRTRLGLGLRLLIALSLPIVTGCNKPDPKVGELEAEVKKLREEVRTEVGDREWQIAALKAKFGEPGAEAGKRRDLLLGKWAGVEAGKTKDKILEFTKDGTVRETWKGEESAGVLGGKGLDSSITVKYGYIWLDDDNIGLALKLNYKGYPLREKHKVAVTKDDLTLTDPDGDPKKYKRVN